MTNKITKETLKMLIEGVLNERTTLYTIPSSDPTDSELKSALGLASLDKIPYNSKELLSVTKELAKEKSPNNVLDDTDFVDAFDGTADEDVENFADFLRKASDNAAIRSAAQEPYKGLEPQSITSPRTYDAGAASGEFVKGIEATFLNVFGSEKDPVKRMEAITSTSAEVFDLTKIEQMTQKQLLQKLLMMDYVQSLTYDIDSKRSGGYQFEAFLAMLFSGEVNGGENGAGDFTMLNGQRGSAKYLKKFDISQSPKGFKDGDEFVYVIAVKRGTDQTPVPVISRTTTGAPSISAQQSTKDNTTYGVEGTAEAKEIVVVDIHLIKVVVEEGTNNRLKFNMKDMQDNPLVVNGKQISKAGNRQSIMPDSDTEKKRVFRGSFIGQIKMVNGKNDKLKLRDFLEKNLAASSAANLQNQKEAFNLLKNYFDSLRSIDDDMRSYITDPNPDSAIKKGNQVLDLYDGVDQIMVNLLNVVKPNATTGASIKAGSRTKLQKTTESKKITQDYLKKLIEESFKKNK